MINVKDLTKYYGPHVAVDGISFDIEAGQVVGFLGPNGAGKTTTLRILTGYMPPTSGAAKVNGYDVFSQSLQARGSIGYLPESNPLYGEMKVREQLHYFGKLHGLDRATRNRRIMDLTERCGLEKVLNRPIFQLSKGNKQRVGLAQAMLHDPPVLILDEPTVGLDPSQITEIRSLVQSLSSHKTILLSTHILPEVERSCQKVLIIAGGRIVAQGSPEELKARVRIASRVILEVKTNEAEVSRVLSQVSHVGRAEVTSRNGWTTAAITPRLAGEDVREILGDVIRENRWPVREIRHESASLEEFFIQVTHSASMRAA